MRPGVEENLGRLERIPSLRLHQVEQEPLQTSTPQGEDMPFPLSPNSGSMVQTPVCVRPLHVFVMTASDIDVSFFLSALVCPRLSSRKTLVGPLPSNAAAVRP